jgi:hypothetical protein
MHTGCEHEVKVLPKRQWLRNVRDKAVLHKHEQWVPKIYQLLGASNSLCLSACCARQVRLLLLQHHKNVNTADQVATLFDAALPTTLRSYFGMCHRWLEPQV